MSSSEQYSPPGGGAAWQALEESLDRAIALDDEYDRRHGLGDYTPENLTRCDQCGARHDFDACPACERTAA